MSTNKGGPGSAGDAPPTSAKRVNGTWAAVAAGIVASAAVLAVWLGSSRTGAARPQLPRPAVVPMLPSSFVMGGARPRTLLRMPKSGEAAVAVAGVGVMGSTADERPVPIASVTKMMTALVVLTDHPLSPSEAGPRVRLTAEDALEYQRDSAANDSSVVVVAGELLSEREMLEALMLPSADNIADVLARWDAGSISAFVRKMNATAARLGMRRTHYADASGLDPKSRSDARDLAILAARDMSIPAFASVVGESWAPMPVAGRVWNINPLLGSDGVIGVKSGFTQAAQGCLAAAAHRQVGGRTVLVIALSLDQPGGVPGAGMTDRALLNAATARLASYTVLPASARVAAVRARWRRSDLGVVGPATPTVVVGWPGLVVRVREKPVRLPPTADLPPRSNESDTTRVDRVVFGITHYSVVETVTLTTDGRLGGVQAVLTGRADASLLAPPDSWLSG